jgi:NADH-quinone oxidoreductase subunit F
VTIATLVSPAGIIAADGRLAAVTCVRNRPGAVDASGRRRPEPVPGSEFDVALDTLIVAISEGSDADCLAVLGANRVDVNERARTVRTDPATLCTSRLGVFAGGDVATGPNTVIDAIAAGKKAAAMIDRYLRGEQLARPHEPKLPETYIEPAAVGPELLGARAHPSRIALGASPDGFAEIEQTLTPEEASREARRCLRCDLDFTRPSALAGAAGSAGAQRHDPAGTAEVLA